MGKLLAVDIKDEGLLGVYVESLHLDGEEQELAKLAEVTLRHHAPEDGLVFDDLRDCPKEMFVALQLYTRFSFDCFTEMEETFGDSDGGDCFSLAAKQRVGIVFRNLLKFGVQVGPEGWELSGSIRHQCEGPQ